MPEGTLVETIYGRSNAYRIYKAGGWIGDKFKVYKDDKHMADFDRLDKAVEYCRRQN